MKKIGFWDFYKIFEFFVFWVFVDFLGDRIKGMIEDIQDKVLRKHKMNLEGFRYSFLARRDNFP